MLREFAVNTKPGKGRCVIAMKKFVQGDVIMMIHVEPCYPIPEWHALAPYAMHWSPDQDCIAFGEASFINHSDDPNCTVMQHLEIKMISILALKDIKPFDELTIKYRCPLWFEPLKEDANQNQKAETQVGEVLRVP